MPRDKTINHIRLMAAAREEFLEYGFEKASMRSIGKRCGLTADRERTRFSATVTETAHTSTQRSRIS